MLEKLFNFFVILVAIFFGDFPVFPSKTKTNTWISIWCAPTSYITMAIIPLIGVINPVTQREGHL